MKKRIILILVIIVFVVILGKMLFEQNVFFSTKTSFISKQQAQENVFVKNSTPEDGVYTIRSEDSNNPSTQYTLKDGFYINENTGIRIFLVEKYPVFKNNKTQYFVWLQSQVEKEDGVEIKYYMGRGYSNVDKSMFVSDSLWSSKDSIQPGRIFLQGENTIVTFIHEGEERQVLINADLF